ncbi:Dps family protein [Sphingomonas sp. M1-B02]|uniref:Dps family protein n=1 Tax=Sphingomonas sp. M1-B02 TaxID=3114300 RepID=UPI00223EF263|nr:DNA starvation/stationary phase protection protein [Sphingomonas sp. S6-11]UZK66288.1 DNA starvation/stationary phase protection protein [Sphingomonas sp. S6-11]
MTEKKLSVAEQFLGTPTDLGSAATRDISAGLAGLLADVFALYLKTKNFHWHMSGSNFRDYHLLLDEQGEQLFAMTDTIAERARKIGGTTIRSIGDIAARQRIPDNNQDYTDPQAMLVELHNDNKQLVAEMRLVHVLSDTYSDVATASLLEIWIDETERRGWFLYESCRSSAAR